MSIKKCVNGSFVNDYYREYGTETDTITTLPKSIIADGQSASANIIGNMVQSGTPSPSSIIMPSETGDKTANLFSSVWEQGSINATTGNNQESNALIRTADFIPITPNTIYSMSRDKYGNYMNVRLYNSSKVYIGAGTEDTIEILYGEGTPSNPMRINQSFCRFKVIANNAAFIRFNDATNDLTTKYMFVEGAYTAQTMPAYQPYGYEIPISSGGTTTPVYLGEVESTRQIKKYEFTGEESISGIGDYYNTNVSVLSVAWSATTSTTGGFQINNVGNRIWAIKSYFSSYATAADFKTYLQQQYAAGTPVTVWYVLATPTTGIVNEPIRKIGNYADSVSVTGIPTTGTAEQFDIDTELKPSEVQLTYHGWHEHSDTKF